MESTEENQSPVSAHHKYGEMPSSNSTKKTAAAAERSDSLQNAANFSGVRKRKRGEYVAEKWDPIMKKRVWLGTYNTAEEAAEAYLAKQCESASAHHVFDEMPSSNSAAVAVGKKPFIQEVSFRNKSTLLAAEWHNMGKLRKRTFKKKQVCKSFNTNMHGKEPVESCKQTSCSMSKSSDRCSTIKRNPKSKSGLLGIRKQKNGRYSAEIRDPIKHKQVWLGTFDSLEEASQAYLSKKSEFDMLTQGNKENKQKNCDEAHPESSVGASLSGLGRKMDSPKTMRIVGVRKNKWGKYTSEIINPISKKKIWLGTFSSYEEASQAYKSKKLEFREIVNVKKKCSKKIHSNAREKQVGKEKLVVTIAGFKPESAAQATFHANQNMKFDVQRSKEAVLKSNMPFDFSTGEKQAEKEKLVVNCEGFQPESAAPETFHANQNMKFDVQRSKEAELKCNMPFDFIIGEKQAGKEKCVVNCEGFQSESAAPETFHANQNMKFDVQRSKEAELKYNMPFDFSTGEKQAGKETCVVNCEGFQPESAAEETFHANQYMKFDVQRSKEAELKSNMPFDFNTGEKQAGKEKLVVNSAADETFHADQCMKFDVWSSKEAKLQSKKPVDFSTGKKQGCLEDTDLSMGQWVQLRDGREVKFSLELGLPIIDNYGALLGEFSGMDNLRIYDESIY